MSRENRAAIYTRVSTDRQAEEGFSLEAQQDILHSVLERKGLQLYRSYSDPGISGGSFKRPGIQAMIADMKAKKFDTILVHKLDRLSRNLGDLYSFIDMINKYDVRLIIAAQGSEEIDTRSPMGKAFLFFSGIWAQIYLENLREETLKGLVTKAKKGGRHMSRPPLGYDFGENNELVVNEQESDLVKEVFRQFLKGTGRNKIAAHMNTYSRMKEGGKWDAKGIMNIITNHTYAGYNHFKPADWSEDRRIITEGTHTPIVSREDFEKAQKYIERRSNNQMSKRSYMYAYSGIVKCGKCGSNYNGNSTKHKDVVYKSYRCHNNYLHKTCDSPSIQEPLLTQLVFEKLVMSGNTVQDKKEKKKKPDIDLHKEVETSNKRRKNWMLALGDGKLSPDDYAMMIDEEDARMKSVYDKIKEEQAETDPEIAPQELIEMMMGIRENWDLLDEDIQKELIQNLFRKIVIEKGPNGWSITELLSV